MGIFRLLNEIYLIVFKKIINKFLILWSFTSSHIRDWVSENFYDTFQILKISFDVGFSNEKWSGFDDIFLNFFPIVESVDEVCYGFLEFFCCSSEIVSADSQNKLELRRLAKGSVMEVSIWEDAMEPISVSVTWLIEQPYLFVCVALFHQFISTIPRIFLFQEGLEGVGDLCFRFSCEAYFGSGVFPRGSLEHQLSSDVFHA